MTRGIRKRPLIEPEPDPPLIIEPAYAYQSGSDTSLAAHQPKASFGTPWKPGQSGNPAGRPRSVSVTEILRKSIDPQALAAELAYHAFTKHNLEAVTYIYDRLDGRPKQQLDVVGDQGTSLLERLVAASEAISRGEPVPLQLPANQEYLDTLIEAPVSQVEGEHQ